MRMRKRTKLKVSFFITLFVGVTFGYFMWLSWQKLTEWIGNSWIVWGITGSIVVIAVLLGYFSIDKIVKRFV